jgi:hypothetical protein
MAQQLNLQPALLDLALYAGDGVSIKLVVTQSADADPIDLTGSVKAQIRKTRDEDETVNPVIVEFVAILTDAYLGIVYLLLTGDDTQTLIEHDSVVNGKFTGVWDIEWHPAEDEPRTLCQGDVECVADVTR